MQDSHVIGDEIEDEPHIRLLERIAEPSESGFAAELGIERTVIDHIVTMRAPRAGLEKGGSVEVTYAERLEIGNGGGCLVKTEPWSELEAIGGERNSRSCHIRAMLQNDLGAGYQRAVMPLRQMQARNEA